MQDIKEVLALAAAVATIPAYTADELDFDIIPHLNQPLSPAVIIVGTNHRDIIVKALRFYAANYL